MLRIGSITLMCAMGLACGNDVTNQSSMLLERTFLSESISVRNEPKPLVDGTRIRLSFPEKNRITATAGCNILSGTVSIANNRLVLSELGSTEMGCDPARHAQDDWLSALLAARPSYRLDGARLVLETQDTFVQLLDREVADPDRPLVQTMWAVDGLISGASATSIPAGTSATVVFDANEVHISIETCNEGNAKVTIGPSTIALDPFVMTDVACSGAPAALETAITKVLVGKVDYEIEAAGLRLTGPDGNGLTLRAR